MFSTRRPCFDPRRGEQNESQSATWEVDRKKWAAGTKQQGHLDWFIHFAGVFMKDNLENLET